MRVDMNGESEMSVPNRGLRCIEGTYLTDTNPYRRL